MKPYSMVRSIVTPLPEPNVDTDQIIPKQFLKMVTRQGFGKYLFYDRRGPGFVLDNPRYAGSRILAAGDNFGCGSSREHAVWALQDFGFDVVVSTSFADIFYSNCIKNGLLPVRLPAADMQIVIESAEPVSVDLESRTLTLQRRAIPFTIEQHHRMVLLEGLDDITRTLQHEDLISAFEQNSAVPSVL